MRTSPRSPRRTSPLATRAFSIRNSVRDERYPVRPCDPLASRTQEHGGFKASERASQGAFGNPQDKSFLLHSNGLGGDGVVENPECLLGRLSIRASRAGRGEKLSTLLACDLAIIENSASSPPLRSRKEFPSNDPTPSTIRVFESPVPPTEKTSHHPLKDFLQQGCPQPSPAPELTVTFDCQNA